MGFREHMIFTFSISQLEYGYLNTAPGLPNYRATREFYAESMQVLFGQEYQLLL